MSHMRFVLSIATLALIGCVSSPSQNNPNAMSFWPADKATLVGLTHNGEQAWQGEPLLLGDKRRIELSRNESGHLVYQWRDTWWSGFRFDPDTPVNLAPYADDGGVVLTLQIDEYDNAGFDIARLCGGGCERKVTVTHQMGELAGKGWQTVKLPAHCMIREGDNIDWVKTPLRLSSGGSGKATFKRIEWHRNLDEVSGTTLDCPDPQTVTVTPEPLNEHWALSWWKPRHQDKLAKAKATDPQVVFIGDSITEGWEKAGAPVWEEHFAQWQPLNLGFGGDRTENVLWRLQQGEVDNIDPDVAVLMIGTNNTGHRQDAPKQIAKGVDALLDELKARLPDTRILLLAIFPRSDTPEDYLRQNNTLTNARLRNLADGEQVVFADLNSVFLERDGTLPESVMPDLLHPNEKGYRLLVKELKPAIERLMPSQ